MDKIDKSILVAWTLLMTALDYFHSHIKLKTFDDLIAVILAVLITGIIFFVIGYIIILLVNKVVDLTNKK